MKKFLKVLIVILIIAGTCFGGYLYISNKVKKNMDDYNQAWNRFNSEYVVKKETVVDYVKGSGEITSFNIEYLNEENYPIKDKYVKDGDTVSQKQKIMKIGGDYETKTLTSSINGIYFEVSGEMNRMTYAIYDTSDVGIEFSVDERDVVKLAVGQKAIVKIVVLNKELEGTVNYISKLPQSGKYKVRVNIPFGDDIKFGFGSTVKITVEEKTVLTVPYSCVEFIDNKYYVLKKENKVAYDSNDEYWNETRYMTEVQIGTISGNSVEIVSGLSEGDIVMGDE
ncbi:MAG: HlyD family efflux transporter periplasmic adaptor subunit [Bacilli bacterium]|nr:HlyD family efflux transporter periplasmic adaptor subunit [Bacilli bacterium]